MKTDEAFCTFDWGQNILLQEFRESQNTYFGKADVSIGRFICVEKPTDDNFSYWSGLHAITNASQTDLDSLSGSETIIKQFKENRKHVKKLHKPTR